ncbi:uncharacterized protein LOC135393329 [Ornithodoros turicata]|uniref:uncharacterized protein LOC135393329 n=1 Tax=Ornithodoros turicata TaxID=34597 RepID=UPI0031396739
MDPPIIFFVNVNINMYLERMKYARSRGHFSKCRLDLLRAFIPLQSLSHAVLHCHQFPLKPLLRNWASGGRRRQPMTSISDISGERSGETPVEGWGERSPEEGSEKSPEDRSEKSPEDRSEKSPEEGSEKSSEESLGEAFARGTSVSEISADIHSGEHERTTHTEVFSGERSGVTSGSSAATSGTTTVGETSTSSEEFGFFPPVGSERFAAMMATIVLALVSAALFAYLFKILCHPDIDDDDLGIPVTSNAFITLSHFLIYVYA